MSDSWNNVRTVCCKPWLVLPTVYSDALSYSEQLDKFCYSLNKIIENNNILPEYVADQIKEYISSGAIGEVVREILANYILNVKYPPKGITPAVGDGSADDTEALQGCIDYASENGGVVYFPYGSYLTQPLTMKSGVSLFGFDRYSTKVVLKGGATKALLNGNASGLSVCGITLDGNSGIQVNNVNAVDMTGSNLMFNELIIEDGYKLFNFVGDGHLQLNDIVFGNAVENCFSVDGNVIVQAKNLLFTALSKVGGVSVIDIKANDGEYDFNSVAKCDTCMMISGNDNKIVALIGGASEDYVDTGEHNNVEIVGHSQKEYYSGNVKKDANNSETTLQGTRSLHVVGESTVTIDSNSTESVDGSKSEIVTGVSSAHYNGDRNINGINLTETFTGKKTTNSKDYFINTENPLTYKKPELFNNGLSYIPFKDIDGNIYYVCVKSEKNLNVRVIDTVKDFENLYLDGIVETKGFYTVGDKGNAKYYVGETTANADNMTVFACPNGLKAVLVPDNNTTFLTVGGKGDMTGMSDKLNAYLKYCVNNDIPAIIPHDVNVGMDKDLYLPENLILVIDGVLSDLSDISIYNKDAYSDVRPGYTGNGNIKITGNGVIDARADKINNHLSTTLRMMHGHDIVIENITLKNFGGYHGIELIACENTTIANVVFDGFISSPNTSENSNIESTIQIESAYAELGQSGATPYDKTPNKNITIRDCIFKGSEGKYINTGIESQAQATTGETYYHENIKIYENKFFNVEHHCIVPYRWTGAEIHNNYAITTGGAFIANISGNLGFSLAESIINENVVYDSAENETVESSDIFAINIHSGNNVNISNNLISGCKTGVLTLYGKCTMCKFNNNDVAYVSKLGSNMFFVENSETTCDIIGNTLSANDGSNASLASLPPNNDKFNGIFLGNRIKGVIFQYRDNKLIGNGDIIYTGTGLVTEITPNNLSNVYSAIKVEFTLGNNKWEKTYNLNDDVIAFESVLINDNETRVLMVNYRLTIDTSNGKIYLSNNIEKLLTISGSNSAISDTTFTAYISKIVGIKDNLRI